MWSFFRMRDRCILQCSSYSTRVSMKFIKIFSRRDFVRRFWIIWPLSIPHTHFAVSPFLVKILWLKKLTDRWDVIEWGHFSQSIITVHLCMLYCGRLRSIRIFKSVFKMSCCGFWMNSKWAPWYHPTLIWHIELYTLYGICFKHFYCTSLVCVNIVTGICTYCKWNKAIHSYTKWYLYTFWYTTWLNTALEINKFSVIDKCKIDTVNHNSQ